MAKSGRVLAFAVLVMMAGLLFSCTSDIESADEILARARGSSSSDGSSASVVQGVSSGGSSSSVVEVLSSSSVELSSSSALPSSSSVVPSSSSSDVISSSSVGLSSSSALPSSSSTTPSSSSNDVLSSSSSSTIPSSSSVVPSSSSVLPSSSSILPSSSSVVPSSSSVLPSSSSVLPSSSSVVPSSSSSSVQCSNAGNGTFIDTRNDKEYGYVTICSQTWMAENLNFAVSDGNSKCGGTNSGSHLSNDNTSACDTYGRLYNWATALTVCPNGWHLPSRMEWEVMTDYIGGDATEGKKLKATYGWNGDLNGTDDYGFEALPGGIGTPYNPDYSNISLIWSNPSLTGNWWSATESSDNSDNAYRRIMNGVSAALADKASWNDNYSKVSFSSVRCVKNEP